MSKPKILVFAPREEPPETIAALEGPRLRARVRQSRLATAAAQRRGGRGRGGARCRRPDGHLHAPHPDQPADHAGVAAAARRRQIHRRGRRHRHRRGDRARRHGVPRADRIQLLRRGRDHGHLHAGAVQEDPRARCRRARRQMARAAELRLLRRQPPDRQFSGPDHRPGRLRAHRHPGGPIAGPLARPHHRLRPLCAAGAFPHPRGQGGRLRHAAAGVRRGVVPRRAQQGDPLHVRRARARLDEALRGRPQHGARQGRGREGAGQGDRGRDASAAPPSTPSRRSRCRRIRRCARSATRCCCRPIRRPTPKAASCARASPGPPARCSPRSPARSRTMCTTKRSSRAGRSASAGRAYPADGPADRGRPLRLPGHGPSFAP